MGRKSKLVEAIANNLPRQLVLRSFRMTNYQLDKFVKEHGPLITHRILKRKANG